MADRKSVRITGSDKNTPGVSAPHHTLLIAEISEQAGASLFSDEEEPEAVGTNGQKLGTIYSNKAPARLTGFERGQVSYL